jgi:hypothetical protein
MKKISAYFISLLLFAASLQVQAQDTVPVPRSIKAGIDLYGPLYNIYNSKIKSYEGFISVETDTGKAVVLEAGYLDYEYSQYNYDYLNKGVFIRAGMDFNMLKPETAVGKYYAGLGLRYGLSIYSTEVPSFKSSNYWGTVSGSVPKKGSVAHFLEVSPGIRTELFRYVEIGWTVRLRFLIYQNAGKDLKPVYIPGFGNATKTFSPGINYYIIISIPYRK